MPHSGAGCQELARTDVSETHSETQLMACKLQRLQQRVGIIRSSAWQRRNVRPHSGRCASGNRNLCVYSGTKQEEKVQFWSYRAERRTK